MKYMIWTLVAAAIVITLLFTLRGNPGRSGTDSQSPSSETGALPQQEPAITTITTNGMKIETTKQGTGEGIVNGQYAVIEYSGMFPDGKVFDATSKHGGKPLTFQLGAGLVIRGWEEGIVGMKVGEERRLTIPSELGYGPNGYPPVIPGNATLIFTVKLVAIE